MKLLYVSTSLAFGGAEAVAVAMARHAKINWGWEVEYVSLLAGGGRRSALESAGIPVHSLGLRPGLPDPRALVRLGKITRKLKPDLIHSHMLHSNLLTQMHRALTRSCPLICTAHSVDEIEGRRILHWMHRAGARQPALTTNVCKAGTLNLISAKLSDPSKTIYVPNGIDLERFQRPPDARKAARQSLGLTDQFTFIAIGRHQAPKDIPCLIDSFEKVLRARPNTILLYVGDGPDREANERKVDSLGLHGNFRGLGLRHDIPELLAASDAFVMSSAWEGLPMVLLEAGAASLPLVSTHVGGTSEIVLDGETGYLVPARRPDLLADKMLQISRLSRDNLLQMGRASRRHVAANFDSAAISERWHSLYEGLINDRGESSDASPAEDERHA